MQKSWPGLKSTKKHGIKDNVTKVAVQGQLVTINSMCVIMDNTDGRIVAHSPYDRAMMFCSLHNTIDCIRYSIKNMASISPKKKVTKDGYLQIGTILAGQIKAEIEKTPYTRGKWARIAREFGVTEAIVHDIKNGRRWKNA